MSPPVLAIGPANFAGQATAWTAAAQRYAGVSAWSFTFADLPRRGGVPRPSFEVGHRLPHPRLPLGPVRALVNQRLLRGVSHLVLDGFLSLADASPLSASEVERLGAGRRIGLLSHGTDTRDAQAHIARWAYSYYGRCDPAWTAERARIAAANRELARSAEIPVFVSTPDLLLDLPAATWLPVCVEPSRWVGGDTPLQRRVPRVLHVPSRRDPPIKGTAIVDPVLRRWAELGRIEYISPAGIPHAEMPALVARVDIVVDQVCSGYYGVAACEAMAAGRIVVGNVGPQVRDQVGEPIPIADIGDVVEDVTVEQRLAALLDDPGAARELAASGPGFVADRHDGRASARVLAEFVG